MTAREHVELRIRDHFQNTGIYPDTLTISDDTYHELVADAEMAACIPIGSLDKPVEIRYMGVLFKTMGQRDREFEAMEMGARV